MDLAKLTDKERAIVVGIVKGMTNEAIAAELRIGSCNVKNTLTRLLKKLGLRNRIQLIAAHFGGR